MPVTLIVKAPNQQIEDQTIQCELSWTIKRLKGYLSEVYPSKPRTEEQKLIYSGHLLNDSCTLKEVLRTYEEGQDQHTVHLVCARNSMIPPRKPDAAETSSSETLRRRNVPGTSASSSNSIPPDTNDGSSAASNMTSNLPTRSSNPNHNSAQATASQGFENPPVPPQDPNQAMPPLYPNSQFPPFGQFPQMPPYVPHSQMIPWTQAQYAAWMHQAYAQYMAHYMHMVSQGSGNPFQWQLPPNVSVRGPQTNFDQQGAVQGQAGNAERAAGAEDGDEEENAGRDWLDWFYMTSRAAALFAFVYFYTTPLRFLVVFSLGLLVYLYNIGFFRPLDDFMQAPDNNNDPARVDAAAAAAANNNVNNDNNNNHQPAAAQGEDDAVIDPEPPADNAEVNEAQENGAAVAPNAAAGAAQGAEPPQPPVPSLLALTWTFFTSFFASLIPEQPGVI